MYALTTGATMSINFEILHEILEEITMNIERVKLDIEINGDDPAFMAVDRMIVGHGSGMRSYLQLQVAIGER